MAKPKLIDMTKQDIDRFWSKVRKCRNGCWEWQGWKTKRGYGHFNFKGRPFRAHRISWFLKTGSLSEFNPFEISCILHKCDNPSCVNPEHLFIGTQQDNADDMVQKNRLPKISRVGQNNGHVKLTEECVINIRREYTEGVLRKELRERYNVSKTAISAIINRRRWVHI